MMKLRIIKTNNWLNKSGYSLEEELKIYDDQLNDILTHTRWYLDNLDYLVSYRVSWGNYSTNRAILPRKIESFINKGSPNTTDELDKNNIPIKE